MKKAEPEALSSNVFLETMQKLSANKCARNVLSLLNFFFDFRK